jgi:hypothetical protein
VGQKEQKAGHALEAKLHRGGLSSARVRVVAGLPGKEPRVRIEGIPLSGIGKLCKAICGKGR